MIEPQTRVQTDSTLERPVDNSAVFRTLCQQYSDLGRLAGVEITPFGPQSNRRFVTLPEPHQAGIIESLKSSITITRTAIEKGIDVEKDNRTLAWWAMSKLGLRPNSELFSQISDDDLIEIYDRNNIQRFRTFNMFPCLSYTLEELFSYEWWELFKRDENVTKELLSISSKILNGESYDPVIPKLEPHLVQEAFSPRGLIAELQTRLAAPLYLKRNEIGGYISVSRIIRSFDPQEFKQPAARTELHLA